MGSPVMAIDCGNTRYKSILRTSDGQILPVPASHSAGDVLASAHPRSTALVLAGAARRVEELIEVAHTLGWARHQIQVMGVDCNIPDLRQYASCGVDRCCAGWAAAQYESAIVCDFGTATTITAWQQGPCFLGGMILPSCHVCSQGLHQAAPVLPVVSDMVFMQADEGPPQALANSTQEALLAGLRIGYPAMVRSCLEQVQAAAGITRVLACGGGLAVIPVAMRCHWTIDDRLVLRGMLGIYDRNVA